MTEALVGAQVHTPEGIVAGRALLLADGAIRDIVADDAVPDGAHPTRLAGGTLAAGFIDLQVNGGGGVMFNDAPTAATVAAIGRAHLARGTTGFLPTFISGARADMARAIAAVRAAMDEGQAGVLGIHFEGPHINPARRGAHDARRIRPLAEGDIELLASLGAGRTLVTLAPERVAPADIAALAARGVIVAAGHSEAESGTIDVAAARGLTGVTHLFNAMGPLGHRAPGVAGAALTRDSLACGIIADGAHVHWDVLRLAWRAKPPGKLFLVSDAMSPVGAPDVDAVRIGDETARIVGGGLRLADGRLAGSLLDMGQAVRNCVVHAGIPLADALAMAAACPADFVGVGESRGRLAPGLRADLVWLDDELRVRATWVGGTRSNAAEE
ncbi:MAG: N-acetylglucosamine-6-phosphate deacetylase [Rhodospirillales bacterium]|nr:N-acetylglucosamine-6-phosphate deacetylase [Rhodospirillales bacterium]MDE0380545.1 N-acetylglucosamine-6-phosphate deacetylase [Rhodospirillales bacterium]